MSEQTFQTLGRYIIQGELGRGGFATVYRALDNKLGREVALKVLKPGWTDDPRAVERFMREATQSAMLKHPNIVTVYDVDQFEGRMFIAMELVPGRSLQRIVAEDGPLAFESAIPILEQSAAALDYAHKHGLVHRDVKPANILLDESESGHSIRVVLTDFGLVRGVEQASLTLGSTGGIVGTPEYIAPEIWDGAVATPASDVYALACVGYYLLTGEALFGAATPMAVIKRHATGPVFPQQWPASVPADVPVILKQALAHDPGQRPATAGELIARLRRYQAQLAEKQKAEQEAVRARQAAEQAAEQRAREAQAEAEQRAREERERQAREAARLAAEEEQRKARAETEQRVREERERQAREAARQEEARRLPQPPQSARGTETTPTPQRPVGWGLWRRWVGATAVGWIAAGISIILGALVARNSWGMFLALPIAPFAVGMPQWLVLRKHIDKAWHWIVATFIGVLGGAVAGGIAGGIVYAILSSTGGYGALLVSFTALFGSGAFGLVLGLAQWAILLSRVQRSGWWIPATVISLAVSAVVAGVLDGDSTIAVLFGAALLLLAQGVITGTVLVWLLRRPFARAQK